MNRVHVGFSAMVLLASASAQDTGSFLPEAAFLSSLKGDVSVVSGANARVTTGVVNARLVGGDRVVTESFSRADIRFRSGDVVRAGANTEVLLYQLENGHYQMQLARGTLDYSVPRPSTANIEIHTPSVSIRPSQVGVYRMTVKGNGESEISARAGRLEIDGPGGAEWLDPGLRTRPMHRYRRGDDLPSGTVLPKTVQDQAQALCKNFPALAREVFAQREFKKIAHVVATVPQSERNSRPSAKETL